MLVTHIVTFVKRYVTMKNKVFYPFQSIFPLSQFYFERKPEQKFVRIIHNG